MDTGYRRGILVIALAALAMGILGLIAARDLAFTADRGALVGTLMAFNPLGALVTSALAFVVIVGLALRIRAFILSAGAGFALAAVLQLVQAGRSTNVLGGRPSTFSFFLFAAIGLLALGRTQGWRRSP